VDELMRRGVVQLVHTQVPRALDVLPDKIVRGALVDDVDIVRRSHVVDEPRAGVQRISVLRSRGAEPGDSEPVGN
jgi:hypothetical protein